MIEFKIDPSIYKKSPSVFRYPGGKSWMLSLINDWFEKNNFENKTIIEPFGGSGVVSLFSLQNNFVKNAIICEIDNNIAAVWKTITGKEYLWLINKILTFEFNRLVAMKL